jgi:hypothetical protein
VLRDNSSSSSFQIGRRIDSSIEVYTQHHNSDPQPFVWTAKAEDIITKYRRAKSALGKVQTA